MKMQMIWEGMAGMTWLTSFRIPLNVVLMHLVRSHTCLVRDGKLTHIGNSLQSLFVIMIPPISSDLSLSSTKLSHHKWTRSQVILSKISMQVRSVSNKCRINPRLTVFHFQPVSSHLSSVNSHLSSLDAPRHSLLSTFPSRWVTQSVLSKNPLPLPFDLLPLHGLPRSTLPSLDDHCVQYESISAPNHSLQGISKHTQSLSQSVHPNSVTIRLWMPLPL